MICSRCCFTFARTLPQKIECYIEPMYIWEHRPASNLGATRDLSNPLPVVEPIYIPSRRERVLVKKWKITSDTCVSIIILYVSTLDTGALTG